MTDYKCTPNCSKSSSLDMQWRTPYRKFIYNLLSKFLIIPKVSNVPHPPDNTSSYNFRMTIIPSPWLPGRYYYQWTPSSFVIKLIGLPSKIAHTLSCPIIGCIFAQKLETAREIQRKDTGRELYRRMRIVL